MALTYRNVKGEALTINELDANFQYFTGSHAITGSLIVSSAVTASAFTGSFIGSGAFTGSFTGSFIGTGALTTLSTTGTLTASGSLSTFNYVSGSVLTPTQSAAPNFDGVDGQFTFATVSGQYYIYVWMNGGWKSAELT
jgi:hypothetical protein